MKKLMYIFFALPILTGCKEKKSAGAMGGMPTPEISVAKRNAAIDFVYCGRTGETGTIIVCHRTYLI